MATVLEMPPNPARPPLEQLSHQVLQSSSDGILAFDLDGRVTFCNRMMELIYGVHERELFGRQLLEVFPFLKETEGPSFRQTLCGERVPPKNDSFPVPPTGRPGFYEARYSPLFEGGSLVGGFVMVRDVTDHKRSEEQLRESENRFRTLADSAPVLLWMSGTDGLCNFFNSGWMKFTGRSLEEEVGTGWAEGVHPEDFQNCMDTYLSAFVARKSFRMEYRLRRWDSEYRWVLDQGMPRYEPGGGFAGYIGSCIDLTDFREAHQALLRMNDELDLRVKERTEELSRSNADLEQFAYVASHDLQEPLRIISSYLCLLEERCRGQVAGDAAKYINYAVDGAKRMQELIRDLLAYARLDQAESPPVAVDCNEAVGIALENLSQTLAETGGKVMREALPTVSADRTLITQLFQNLIQNALKFHGENTPVIHIRAKRAKSDWLFSVRDNGIGIEPQYGERIFRVFQRLHGRKEYPGTGIGLSICKKIVERQGGRIWMESKLGKGTTFFFTLAASGVPPSA